MLSSARRICYRILNPKIIHDKNQIKSDVKLPFYPVVGLKQTKTGIMRLNKPDNNNNITSECSDQLFRFFSSFQHDHTVENVWLYNSGPSFSGGADYEQLLNNPDYLDKLMRLSIKIGQFNKPVFAKVFGSVRGIGAYLLTMLSTPMGTQKSALRLDQTSKGFIPIFGGSHKLSRIPCHIGIYLALTGDRLDADQMNRLGFLRGKVRDQHSNKKIWRHLSDANLFMKHYYSPSSHGISEIRRQNEVLLKMNYFDKLLQKTQIQILSSDQNIRTKLAVTTYRQAQTDYYNTINPENTFAQTSLKVNNYFQMKHDRPYKYMRQLNIVQEGYTQNNVLARLPTLKMLRIFSQNTLHQVMEQLKKDDSQWARKTEQMIRQKDPLSVHLAFKLIKESRERSWVECVEQQYRVARRIINISKIKTKQISKDRSIQIFQNPYSNLKIQQISQETINSFFRPAQKEDEIFDHDTPNHSFIPTSDYWRQYPDAARNYLNRTFFDDYHARLGEVQVKRFLHSKRIDYRDKSYNISTLRQYLYKQQNYERLIEIQKQRLRAIFNSQIQYLKLKQSRKQYVESKIKQGNLEKVIQQQIKLYFEQKFQQKYTQLEKTAKIAGKESRMEIIRKYIKVLTQNIVMNGQKIENEDRASNLRHAGIVRFDDKGSDVFHAQTQVQAENNQLNILKDTIKNHKGIDGLSGIDSNTPKQQYLFFKDKLSDWQQNLANQDAELRLNYEKSISNRQTIKKYRYLIEKAAKTSEQIAGLLGWEDSDIESVMTNAPKTQITFRRFAQRIVENSKQDQIIEQRVAQLNDQYNVLLKMKNQELPLLLKQKNQETVNNLFFDTNVIPRPFKTAHLQLLQEVIKFFSHKYQINGQINTEISDKKPDIIKKWAKQGLRHSFTQLMKNDVEYVFSYLAMIHLKQMLSKLNNIKNEDINDIIHMFKVTFGVNFTGVNKNQLNNYIIKYLYSILDMHEDSKHRIIFPQTKLLELVNRLKIDLQLENKLGISFQTLMAMIGRDRKMIRDSQNGIQPYLGYDPEINLTILNNLKKQIDNPSQLINYDYKTEKFNIDTYEDEASHLNNFSATVGQNKDMKRLILGFPHYLRRFQAMMHRVAGNTMFLPKQLYELNNKKLYQNAQSILRVELNNQQWFTSKIKSSIKNLFQYRFQQEKRMTEGELRMFDQSFKQFFKPEMMRVLIKYQTYFEESIASMLIGEQQKLPGTNQEIKSLYLDIKGEIKNPRALKIFNNLVMTQSVVKDRLHDLQEQDDKSSKRDDFTNQQRRDIDNSSISRRQQRTIERLSRQMLRYPDMASIQPTEQNIKEIKQTLGDTWQYKPNHFLDQLKFINNKLDKSDLKEQLKDRLRRIQALDL